MKKTVKTGKVLSAEQIARLAEKGQDISGFFTGKGRMVRPIQRVNLDLTASMLEELDQAAADLNISRQAVIKTLVRQALDQHYLARRAKPGSESHTNLAEIIREHVAPFGGVELKIPSRRTR
jgi:hypothetical protein